MKITAFTTLYFLTSALLFGQENQQSLAITGGINQLINKDLYRSDFKYSGINYPIAINYEKYRPKGLHQGFAEFSIGKLKTTFSTPAPFSLFHMNYGYLRKISGKDKLNIYLGAAIQGLSWKINYFPDMQVPYYAKVQSHILAISAGLQGQADYKISARSHLSLSFITPLCTYADRPKFLDGSPKQVHFGFFNTWNPQLRLTYEYKVSQIFSILVRYDYSYLYY